MIDLYLFRHGESEVNKTTHLVGGRSNWAKLTQEGENQAKLLGQRLFNQNIKFDYVYASPAVRATTTAHLACEEINFPLENIIISDLIQELSQGSWEGKPREECYTPEVMKILNSRGWDFKAPGGESRKEVEDRMVKFLENEVLPKYNQDKSTSIAVFSHGMAIKCLFRHIMDSDQAMTYKIILHNTSITQFRFTERGWFIERVNDGAHISRSDTDNALANWMYGNNK